MTTLQFAPWTSDIELAFYAALANLKINHDRLDDSARKVRGLYEIRPSDAPERSSRLQIHGNALTSDEIIAGFYRAEGIIKNYNTLEEYKNANRSAVIERAGRTIWDAIHDGSIYSCPSLLSSFSAISYADLKKYKFTYHFAFPAIHSEQTWKIIGEPGKEYATLTSKETTQLVDAVQTWKYGVDGRQHGFFLAKKVRHFSSSTGEERPKTPQTPGTDDISYVWQIGALSSYEQGFFTDIDQDDRFICFADPSTFAQYPGWMLRNLLILVRQKWRLNEVQILCYRDTHLRRDQSNSIIIKINSPKTNEATEQQVLGENSTPKSRPRTPQMPKVTGWERNEQGRLNSKLVDLAAYMDPQRLADQAVDLNLKLIKWRIAPGIDLEVIKNTKCLLLGAGTLGAYVSRNLMGWGVRKITFVDNATVSFSNPVRQPLFDFKDCIDGGTKKAHRAADALMEIYPGVDAQGHAMSVPMAGHPITEEAKTQKEFEKLKSLIDEHDVIFLLMDTRESRWLPTVMGKSAGKIVLNAALGFDTFVVMRHGLKAGGPDEEELGCYFCNDVVAPADSLKDATLDQQCTVTRPGIAPIASAILVEMLVSILQHPLRAHAPATNVHTVSESDPLPPPSSSRNSPANSMILPGRPFSHPLGALPHQIRGFLRNFNNLLITGKPYDCCSACSDRIIDLYKKDGWEFVKRALNERGWVEEVSGLAEVQRKAEEMMAGSDIEGWDEDGEADEGEGELI